VEFVGEEVGVTEPRKERKRRGGTWRHSLLASPPHMTNLLLKYEIQRRLDEAE
jgi:hypothetical protein